MKSKLIQQLNREKRRMFLLIVFKGIRFWMIIILIFSVFQYFQWMSKKMACQDIVIKAIDYPYNVGSEMVEHCQLLGVELSNVNVIKAK
jgi:hypothetical protein